MPSGSCKNPGPKLSLSPPAVTAGVVSAAAVSGTDGPAAVVSGTFVVSGAAVVGAAVAGAVVAGAAGPLPETTKLGTICP